KKHAVSSGQPPNNLSLNPVVLQAHPSEKRLLLVVRDQPGSNSYQVEEAVRSNAPSDVDGDSADAAWEDVQGLQDFRSHNDYTLRLICRPLRRPDEFQEGPKVVTPRRTDWLVKNKMRRLETPAAAAGGTVHLRSPRPNFFFLLKSRWTTKHP
ncbi:hypothetical protein AVEN_62572-1, partial [Araneus ventricosus]